jgi:methylphosphotriester-DNA--protein-cysteine methyltransferase
MIIMLGVISFEFGRLSVYKNDKTNAKLYINNATSSSEKTNSEQQGKYVASKTGKAYHLPWCSGARRIKDENKIWFTSKEEAESAGYAPASNCKGI